MYCDRLGPEILGCLCVCVSMYLHLSVDTRSQKLLDSFRLNYPKIIIFMSSFARLCFSSLV